MKERKRSEEQRERGKREREREREKRGQREREITLSTTPVLVSRSFTYPNEVRLVLILRASPRARAPSSPMLFLRRLWAGWLKERGGGMERGFEMREERREVKEAESKSGIKE